MATSSTSASSITPTNYRLQNRPQGTYYWAYLTMSVFNRDLGQPLVLINSPSPTPPPILQMKTTKSREGKSCSKTKV